MHVNRKDKTIHFKIVYHGAGLCGKTTNLQEIFSRTRPQQRLSQSVLEIPTQEDKTLTYDIMPLTTTQTIRGLTPIFSFYTVPGQVHYVNSRKLILDDVDGIVFVADSQLQLRNENMRMLSELKGMIQELDALGKVKAADVAYAFQFNKQDLPSAMDVEMMRKDLIADDAPFFSSSAIKGVGVMETMQTIVQMTIGNHY